ncbi:hypothetical protein MPNT_10046 [Candidatus Methylacidithermus pantelleriae]|uniref:Uncharacterized protein n=1 Tax=Candidatus Methylacidithermus pantelleriae TaxID=2744239 RepID=A0A8J2FRH2_9BACT|nr:hypothetical protein MPNT_10046 [Candidatus Methylacidithermus pantelleriae]
MVSSCLGDPWCPGRKKSQQAHFFRIARFFLALAHSVRRLNIYLQTKARSNRMGTGNQGVWGISP